MMISRYVTLRSLKKSKLFYCLCSVLFIGICILYLCLINHVPKNEIEKDEIPLHSLCVMIPFRNRFEELLVFTPHISKFLKNQGIHYQIIVVNQIDEFRFNRGALMNVAFRISVKKYPRCDYFAIHDVDLLPLNENISYAFPGNGAFHVSSPALHPRYHYTTFIGGILLLTKQHYIEINGMTNRFWGWGIEDDELYMRLKDKNINLYRPGPLSTDYTNSFRHIHGTNRKRDFDHCYNQSTVSIKRDRNSGVKNVVYKITSMYPLTIDSYPLEVFNVKLHCDRTVTPWCICPPKPIPVPPLLPLPPLTAFAKKFTGRIF